MERRAGDQPARRPADPTRAGPWLDAAERTSHRSDKDRATPALDQSAGGGEHHAPPAACGRRPGVPRLSEQDHCYSTREPSHRALAARLHADEV